jgi:LysM repeat protein
VGGVAADQFIKEKVVLCSGNVDGVEKVEDNLSVEQSEPESKYYTVVKGDTLSKIAKQYYGDPNTYPAIFEANRPMLSPRQDLSGPDVAYSAVSLRLTVYRGDRKSPLRSRLRPGEPLGGPW